MPATQLEPPRRPTPRRPLPRWPQLPDRRSRRCRLLPRTKSGWCRREAARNEAIGQRWHHLPTGRPGVRSRLSACERASLPIRCRRPTGTMPTQPEARSWLAADRLAAMLDRVAHRLPDRIRSRVDGRTSRLSSRPPGPECCWEEADSRVSLPERGSSPMAGIRHLSTLCRWLRPVRHRQGNRAPLRSRSQVRARLSRELQPLVLVRG